MNVSIYVPMSLCIYVALGLCISYVSVRVTFRRSKQSTFRCSKRSTFRRSNGAPSEPPAEGSFRNGKKTRRNMKSAAVGSVVFVLHFWEKYSISVLLCTTKRAQSTSQSYFVLQISQSTSQYYFASTVLVSIYFLRFLNLACLQYFLRTSVPKQF